MDRVDRRRNRSRNHKGKKPPKVPIKTYRWEDIRRWRRRGGYPWTHLYKGPYLEKVDPNQFTMDAFRRTKSSDRIDASEVSSWADYSGKTTPTLLHELTRDVPPKKTSRPGSLIVDDDLEDDVQIKEYQPESAESSSENVSQYMDKEESYPKPLDVKPKKTTPVSELADRKRKLSTESGQSFLKRIQEAKRKIKVPKISFCTKKFTKKGAFLPKDSHQKVLKKQTDKTLLRKVDDYPQYIYIPLKLPPGQTDEFSYLEFESADKELIKTTTAQRENQTQMTEQALNNKSKHSNDICEDNMSETEEHPTIQEICEIHDDKDVSSQSIHLDATETENPEAPPDSAGNSETISASSRVTPLKKCQKPSRKSPLKINPAVKQFLKDVRNLKNSSDRQESKLKMDTVQEPKVSLSKAEIPSEVNNSKMQLENLQSSTVSTYQQEPLNSAQINISSGESKVLDRAGENDSDAKQLMLPHTSKNANLDAEIHANIQHTEDKSVVVIDSDNQIEEPRSSDDSDIAEDDQFDMLFEAGSSKSTDPPSKDELKMAAGLGTDDENVARNIRSKSAEPEKKRKLSLESRKSLSRLRLMKKIRELSGKVTNALSVENFKQLFRPAEGQQKNKSVKKDDKLVKKESKVKKEDKLKKPRSRPTEPVYIRIPLKPPEGETDEFSYLDQKENDVKNFKIEERTDSLDTTSSLEVKGKDIQLIFLTPPSDDELLDKDPDIPETPSIDEVVSFGTLKKLAQDVVDQVSPDTKKANSETIGDISGIQSLDPDGSQHTIEDEHSNIESNMIVDVEDGLNEAAKTDDNRKSALKTNEPTYQKRVSFKRKFRVPKDAAKDNEYEIIQAPSEGSVAYNPNLGQADNTEKSPEVQLTSPKEEITDLPKKIVEDASSKNDVNSGLKVIGDHEYEPISAPQEVTILPSVLDDDDPKLIISAAEILDRPIEDKKKSIFQFGRFRKDSNQSSKSANLVPEGSSDIPEREVEDTKKSKFFKQFNRFRKGPAQDGKEAQSSQPDVPQTKPNIRKSKFRKIDFKRFKPNINLHIPQLPDTATIRFPHISLPGTRKTTETRTVESRQFSTESNADDSEHGPKRHRFDLNFRSTFPRFAKKKKSSSDVEAIFATAPRAKKNEKKKIDDSNIRIPLHSQSSMGTAETPDFEDENDAQADQTEYERGVDMSADANSLLNRWKHGSFRERPQDVETEERIIGQLVEQRFGMIGQGYRTETLDDTLRKNEDNSRYIDNILDEDKEEFVLGNRRNNQLVTDLDNLEDDNLDGSKDGYSSEGSESLGQKGRLGKLDIDSDEFFVVHEIREGFQTPANALAQMNEYDPIGSNQYLQQMPGLGDQTGRRKPPIKKPKRKKTPHVSREEIQGDQESIEAVILPSRPKRRSEKRKNKMEKVDVVPYQETISLHGRRLDFPRESLGILGDDEGDNEDIKRESFQVQSDYSSTNRKPGVPTRKHKSQRSLNQSETGSLLETDSSILQDNLNSGPPRRPSRRSDSVLTDLGETQQGNGNRECVEEPCTQNICDYMGYAIVDKSKQRDPPLPPPRTLPRRSKRELDAPHKFATLPGTQPQVPPVRPLRNYSTLGHARTSPKHSPQANKENDIDIGQYMEINNEDVTRDLVSGEVVQKMQRRPLPAPPRPPRKPKTNRRSLQDITSKANILEDTVSTQTEPLPPDFVCEEISEEPTDKVIFPRVLSSAEEISTKTLDQKQNIYENKPAILESGLPLQNQNINMVDLQGKNREFLEVERNKSGDTELQHTQKVETYTSDNSQLQKFHIYDPRAASTQANRKELITPSMYTFEETVTHGTLLVQPLDGTCVTKDQQPPKERVVPVTRADSTDDFESSEIPESFQLLKAPQDPDLEVTETQHLQVTGLDVDSSTLNQLRGPNNGDDHITQVPHSSSSDVRNLQSSSDQEQYPQNESIFPELTQIGNQYLESPQYRDSSSFQLEGQFSHEEQNPPPTPPRRSSALERSFRDTSQQGTSEQVIIGTDPAEDIQESPTRTFQMLEPEIDDEAPPPRPPHPRYVPSQPPAAFYALRAQKYVDEHIPVTPPLRKRQHRCRPLSRSRSTSEEEVSSTAPRRSHKLSRRASEASIPELSRRLMEACGSRVNNTLKRLIFDLTQKFLRNADGNQDLHVVMVILLVLIAGLILLGYGDERTVVHLHHWEYFNPPKDL